MALVAGGGWGMPFPFLNAFYIRPTNQLHRLVTAGRPVALAPAPSGRTKELICLLMETLRGWERLSR